jgi:hypothetical protein
MALLIQWARPGGEDERMTPEKTHRVGHTLKAMAAVLAEAGDVGGARSMEQQAERYLAGKAVEPGMRLVRLETKKGSIALNPAFVQQVTPHAGNSGLCEITLRNHTVVVVGEFEAVLRALQRHEDQDD